MPPIRLLATALLTAAAFQAPAASPSFEVASIRPSAGEPPRREGKLPNREHIQISPDTVTMRNVSLKSCIRWAYGVMDYQVSGPEWMATQRFDIVAKAPSAASEDDLRVMMQKLLAERFQVALHRQTKELSAYVLVVGKNGPKFHESKSEGEMNIQPQPQRMAVVVERAPVSQLVEILSNVLHAPVLDETGLKGRYDVTFDVAKYIPTDRQPGDAPPDPIAIIMTGIQEELGLKLESRKTTVDLVIVDHAEKVPVEN